MAARMREMWTSTDLVNWKPRGSVFKAPHGGAWAPDVFHNKRGDGKFQWTDINDHEPRLGISFMEERLRFGIVMLKEKNPAIKIIAVQPTEGHDVPGLRNLSQLEVSKLFDRSLLDEILETVVHQADVVPGDGLERVL